MIWPWNGANKQTIIPSTYFLMLATFSFSVIASLSVIASVFLRSFSITLTAFLFFLAFASATFLQVRTFISLSRVRYSCTRFSGTFTGFLKCLASSLANQLGKSSSPLVYLEK